MLLTNSVFLLDLRRAFHDARVQHVAEELHNDPARAAKIVQLYLAAIKRINSVGVKPDVPSFEEWLQERKANFERLQERTRQWLQKDQQRKHRESQEASLFLSRADVQTLLKNGHSCASSAKKAVGLNVSVIFRQLSKALEKDLWARKEVHMERIFRANYLLSDDGPGGMMDGGSDGTGAQIAWESVARVVEQSNATALGDGQKLEGSASRPMLSFADAVRFLSQRGISYSGTCRRSDHASAILGCTSQENVFPLTLVRHCLEQEYSGRLPRGQRVVDCAIQFLHGHDHDKLQGLVGSVARSLVRSKNGVGFIQAGSFAEAQVRLLLALVNASRSLQLFARARFLLVV